MRRMLSLTIMLVMLWLAIPASTQSLPNFSDLPMGEWTQIEMPDGICLYGEPYSFFVRPNETPTDNLLVYFQGGGACWDGFTCGSIGEFASFYDVSPQTILPYTQGIFDFDNPDNPLGDYHVVFLPYCSGDVYSGSNQVTFDVPPEASSDVDEIDVYFNGHINSQMVLDWVYENILDPQQIVISGCSAGGYGAVTHAPYIMEHYAGVPAAMIADSSHGVLPASWDGLLTWGTLDNLPAFVPDMAQVTVADYDTTLQIELSAAYFPDNQFAQFNSYLDGVQIGFYGRILGQALSTEEEFVALGSRWSAELLNNIRRLSILENFSYYTAGGFQHCVVNSDLFYEYDQNGIVFAEWFAAVVERSASNVSCSILAGECFTSPLEEN